MVRPTLPGLECRAAIPASFLCPPGAAMRDLEPWDPSSSPSQSRGPWMLYWNGLVCVSLCRCGHVCICACVCVGGFPGGSVVESTCQYGRLRRCEFDLWVGKTDLWKRKWQPAPIFLPGEFHGQRSLVDYIAHGVTRFCHD